MTRTAVITMAHGRRQHLARQQLALAASDVPPDLYVLVAMDDPELAAGATRLVAPGLRSALRVVETRASGGRLPLAAARNLGARTALAAGAEVLIFLDVDCLPAPELVAGYRDVARTHPGWVWSGPVTYLAPAGPEGYRLDALAALDSPHPARPALAPGEVAVQEDPNLFWSLSFAMHRDAWTAAGGFHEGYAGYGGEDTDFARIALAAGLRLGWTGAARAYHQHHPVREPPVDHLDDILRNGRLFYERWGEWPMRGWLAEFEALGLAERRGEHWCRVDSATLAG